jgi:hypothetical protein
MVVQQEKICGICNAKFICNANDIANCQCYGIKLTAANTKYLAEKNLDCVCKNCLVELSKIY